MTCPSCHAEVPPGQLVCDCFQVNADKEVQERALAAFIQRGQLLYRTSALTSGHHLLPARKNCLSLCHKKRFHFAKTSPIVKDQFLHAKPDEFCKACAEVVNAAIRGVDAA